MIPLRAAGDRTATVARLLSPRSLVIVGASEQSAWTHIVRQNLQDTRFSGQVYLVNPKYSSQFGEPCYASVRDLPAAVDHAFIQVGSGAVLSVLADCAACGIGSVTVLTAGFKETGPEGAERERAVVTFCEAHHISLLGPNCLGFINALLPAPVFGQLMGDPPRPGQVGLVLQSGALMLYMYRLAVHRNIGISYLVSTGNEGQLAACDFLRFLVEDPNTKVVGALLEDIRQPADFAATAQRALELGKPIVVMKIGRSALGARAAAAHTGALAAADAVVDAYLSQLGVIRVDSAEELVETCGLLQACGWPEGRRAGVVAFSGGACGILADLLQGSPIELPAFSPETMARLSEILPPFGTPQNPLDCTGCVMLDDTLFPRAIEAVGRDPGLDFLVVVQDPPREAGPIPGREERRLRLVLDAVERCGKPCYLLTHTTAELTPFGRDLVERSGHHFVNGLTFGAPALTRALAYGEARQRLLTRGPVALPEAAQVQVQPLLAGRRGTLDEVESKAVLRAYGIAVTHESVTKDAREAMRAAEAIGYPVVLKVIASDVPHKTEAGGVALNLTNAAAVLAAYDRIMTSVHRFKPDAQIEGVLVAEQLQSGTEMIAGVSIDPRFGPVVLCGLGGIFVETLQDVAMRLAPFDLDEARRMIDSLRTRAILTGVRGRPPADLAAMAQALVRLGQLAIELQDVIRAVDINPLFVLPEGRGVVAADALVVLRQN